MKKPLAPSKKAKSPPPSVRPKLAPDDRLVPDQPLDETKADAGDHRIPKIEPNDEHNAEELIEEGMQGYMHGSLTKPRKAAKKK
jgi:hypothetical protein